MKPTPPPPPPPPKPYDARVEYLESSGTQYIDTEILPQEYTPNIEISYQKIANVQTNVYTASNRWAWNIEAINDNGRNLYWMGTTESAIKYDGLKIDSNYKITLIDSTITIEEDGVQVVSASAIRRTCSHSICFFGQLILGKVRIYYLKVFKGPEPVFDAIPVEKEGVGYMYDKVSERLFGNAGTGEFVIGPVIG